MKAIFKCGIKKFTKSNFFQIAPTTFFDTIRKEILCCVSSAFPIPKFILHRDVQTKPIKNQETSHLVDRFIVFQVAIEIDEVPKKRI